MKKNLPVTQQEVEVPEGVSLVSKTDLKGKIRYASDAFSQLSGFPVDELIGQSHNVVRHPDMPPAVFEDMWATLQSGKPWKGLIKNRCKNGDFYWVEACVVPIRRGGHTIGYMSVRNRTTPEAIAQAEAFYAQVASQGMPRNRGWLSWWSIRSGMRLGTAFVALMMLAGGALGIGGLKLADAAFSRMYQAQFEPVNAVGQIEVELNAVRADMLQALLLQAESKQNTPHTAIAHTEPQTLPEAVQQDPNAQVQAPVSPTPVSPTIPSGGLPIEKLQEHYEDVDGLLAKIQMATQTSADTQHTSALERYVAQGRQLLTQLKDSNGASTNISPALVQKVLDLESRANQSAQALRKSFSQAAEQEFTETLQRNERIRNLALAGIALGLLAVAVIGSFFIRSIVNPLNAAIRQLDRIAEGELHHSVELTGTGETAKLNHAASVMQLHLKVMLDEIALAARSIHRHCKKLNASLYEVAEHSEAQHDQVYAAIRALEQATSETSDLSARAERLLNLATLPDDNLAKEVRELATATRLTGFGAEEVAASMQQVGNLIVENRSEAQLAWQASEELMHTASELNNLVDFFDPNKTLDEFTAQPT